MSIVDTSTRKTLQEIKFFIPGGKVATGEYPFDVAIKSTKGGAAAKAFISSQRDDEVVAVDIATQAITRIPVGSQPNKILLSPDENLLYVANGNSDSVAVIDTNRNRVTQIISLSRPRNPYKGANPNSLALSPNKRYLYVTLGGENAVAVVNLRGNRVIGRIPTGWYPNSVSVSRDGKLLYVVNAKSNSGPNPSYPSSTNPLNNRTTPAGEARNTTFRNEYTWALEKAGIAVIPVPDRRTLESLSMQVDQNNGFTNRRPDEIMSFLQTKIKHVIYVVKENRTYDQVLGNLPVGNGDPELTVFPQPVSPNHDKLSLDFVTFDNFYDSGESSGVGWNWSTYGRTTDYTEKAQSVSYGNASGTNGLSYDYEGNNRKLNLALPQTADERSQFDVRLTGLLDPSGSSSILPGSKDVNAPEGDGELDQDAIGGYLWDAALRAGKTVRNYGFYVDGQYDTSQTDPTRIYWGLATWESLMPTPSQCQIHSTKEPNFTPYAAIVPGNLCNSPVAPDLVPACKDSSVEKTAAIPARHNQQWWAKNTKNFNFAVEDKLDPEAFNRILWAGIKGDQVPYPTQRHHADLRQNRAQLLENTHLSSAQL